MKNTGKTIFFVEDNPLVLTIYRNWLQREGFKIESAADGLAAIEKLPKLKPDLVILDWMLPKLNGLDVLQFIREHADLKDTPVLILSNAYMDERASKVITVGANKRLLKTQCTSAKLIQAIRELMGTAPQSNSSEASEDSLQETRAGLLKDAPGEIAKIREYCLTFVKTAGTPENAEPLNNLYQRVRFLCARAGLGDCTKIAHLVSALEAMLFEIIFKKTKPSASVLQTIAQSVDCLGRLFQTEDVQSADSMFKARVLVVDDDPICTFATVAAMKRAKLEAVSAQDPVAALELMQQENYDIVLLDISMPGMNGFEVCEKLRLLSGYQKTPVIFVTSNSEFQNRAQAILSGGDDLIAKPISPLELALKIIIHLIEPRERPTTAKSKIEVKTAPAIESIAPQIIPIAVEKADEPVKLKMASDKSRTETNRGSQTIPAVHRNESPVRKSFEIFDAAPLTAKQPPVNRINPPPTNGRHNTFMKNQTTNNSSFDKLTCEVARILFGDDNPAEMPLRLTRLALERYNVPEIISGAAPAANGFANGSKPHGANEPFDCVAREVTSIIFGDQGSSEMHLRLTRIALERYNVPQIINGSSAELNGRNGSHANHVSDVSVSL
jgi:DNA-binding response OmpR family regulator